MLNIAFLIPITSNGSGWNNINESYLKNNLLKSIMDTCSNNKYILTFYFGIDDNEKIYTKNNIKLLFESIKSINTILNYDITIYNNIKKGYLTKMWNILFEKAYKSNLHTYYYQCGDDIFFKDNGWLNLSIQKLKSNKDLGISGPKTLRFIKNNKYSDEHVMTQVLISNTHYKLFGKLFPEELKNWYCDDWLNYIYKKHINKLETHGCVNFSLTGNNRYVPRKDKKIFIQLAEKDIKIVEDYEKILY